MATCITTSPCGNVLHRGISGNTGPTIMIMMDGGRDNCVECPNSGNDIEVGEVKAEACADLDMVVNGTENEAVLNVREGAAPESNTDAGPASDDEEEEQVEFRYEKIGTHRFVPTIAEAEAAFADIKKILKPPCKKGPGYLHHGLDDLTHSRIEAMRKFLWKYVAGNSTGRWVPASLQVETAHDHERGPHHARQLREWTHAFIANRKDLPKNIYGTWKIFTLKFLLNWLQARRRALLHSEYT
jgi:hypothetical protein